MFLVVPFSNFGMNIYGLLVGWLKGGGGCYSAPKVVQRVSPEKLSWADTDARDSVNSKISS